MSYTDEYQTELRHIHEDNQGVQGLPFFLSTAASWHARYDEDTDATERTAGQAHPHVIVLGHGLPEQLIYACGVRPYFLRGGSLASCHWSDDLVPRDSDPVSRSILGYAMRLVRDKRCNPLFVVPMANDNLRKIAYLLKREGHAVVPVDIQPEGASLCAQRTWEASLHTMVHAIRQHARTRITAQSIRYANWLVGNARAAMVDLEQTLADCDGALSSEAGLLVLETYYQTNDLVRWADMVRQLTAEVRARHHALGSPQADAPRVIVMGSPLVFPQYKVPALIHDAGLSLVATVDAASTARFASLSDKELRGGTTRLVRTIARKHYALDSSSAHVVNDVMENYVAHLVSTLEVDGVICHVLKGHIEYDFELARLEGLLDSHDIPVFRLETDYQYQDVEQLRIRLEAFAEMLEQRAFVARNAAAYRRCA